MKKSILLALLIISAIAVSVILRNRLWKGKNNINPSIGTETNEESSKKYDFINREKAVLDLDGDGEPELAVAYTRIRQNGYKQ